MDVDWQTPEIKHAIKTSNVYVFEIPITTDYAREWKLYYGLNTLLPVSTSLVSYFDAQVHLRPWSAARALEGAMSGENIHLYAEEGEDNKQTKNAEERDKPVRG